MTVPVSESVRRDVQTRLGEIETRENIRILAAVESGSRAWGFHSPDSDYDVRFVYARPLDWHFRLGKKRDVIECPINAELDISGWELSKSLQLAVKSNAVIAEWLQSPIVYRQVPSAVSEMLEFTSRALDRAAVTWHYVSLYNRQKSRLSHTDGGIKFKRWFYMLRPALALRWIRLNQRVMPPMDMTSLRAGCSLGAEVSSALDRVVARKMAINESDRIEAADDGLSVLMETELCSARDWLKREGKTRRPDLLDDASELHMKLSLSAFA